MLTIGQVAKQFQLSRSTLLYYDSIELLLPTARSEAGYRRYSKKDLDRLAEIISYRKTGLPLKAIKHALDSTNSTDLFELLKRRMTDLNREINERREQQAVIARLLKKRGLVKEARLMTKETWVRLLRAAGLSDAEMKRWHEEFERAAPESHQDFLESLRLSAREIARICQSSRRQQY
jgi:DNA-binding transcriptional MerR regulator